MNFSLNLFYRVSLQWRSWLLIALAVTALSACASGPHLVDHSFEFDARRDSPDVEILDYRYGTSNHPGARGCPKQYSHCDKIPHSAGITGEMLLGDDLFVKWRIKLTGEVYEDTVDLRGRLPADMKNQRIRFIVSGPQLFIYLISQEKLNPNPCPPREELRRLKTSESAYDKVFSYYCDLKIVQIYPNQPASRQSK